MTGAEEEEPAVQSGIRRLATREREQIELAGRSGDLQCVLELKSQLVLILAPPLILPIPMINSSSSSWLIVAFAALPSPTAPPSPPMKENHRCSLSSVRLAPILTLRISCQCLTAKT
ncbi:hypothetical protein PIB30_082279 [Stylosanthes scabra]|uniref:Uncharacterized protein n=1 Tax=Stylosanthes scabra TaxID=79078 RepID=A0ABU6YR45_9FABA|nr:hypothetical protein [Stylosanthes scabra]